MVKEPPFKERYRPDEVAEALEVSVRTVYRWMSEGSIRHVHFRRKIRIAREEMERILREGVAAMSPPVM